MAFTLAVQMDAEGQILGRLEEIDLFAEKERIRAKVDILFALDQPCDNLRYLWVQ